MGSPLVTVIIPCYNYARFLQEAVESILGQSYANWECLIIDDGSLDDSAEVSKRLAARDARIKYHFKINGGLSSARNLGIKLSNGDFVCFLDADDRLDENKLSEQLKCFEKNSSAEIVYGKSMFYQSSDPSTLFNNKDGNSASIDLKYSGRGKDLVGLLLKKNITVISSPLLKKNVFEKAGTFDEKYRSYEDWHFWFKCALADLYFVYCAKPEVCTYIRFGHESMMSDKSKLLNAGLQLRKQMNMHLNTGQKLYNYYRMLKSYIKLLTL